MNDIKKSEGYILVLTLMILSIITIIATQLFNRGTVHIHFDQTMIEREKAKTLALGGIQLAFSQLSLSKTGTGEGKQDNKEIFKRVIPVLNRVQEFSLNKKVDGIDGSVSIVIMCEQGKIDINQFFDFEQKKFINEGKQAGDAKKLFQEIFNSMRKFDSDKDLFSSFEKFLKQRNYKLTDVTELLTIPEFQRSFSQILFYEPPIKGIKAKRPIYLTDIFTVYSNKKTLQPWFLSDSICALFNLKRAESGDIEKRLKYATDIAKEFKGFTAPAAQIWEKQLQPFYGKDFKGLPKFAQELLQNPFEPTMFSVLSFGKIGAITQKIFAIIERRAKKTDAQEEFIIQKLYWL
ncbi:MAG: hypothetical protein WDZ41_02835 [Candidatus Babeliales bacterium]